ncbi:MAG: SLBB domain-containing protein [Sphingomonadales bacterium]|nr:SLBB domain-containing protein [Sphingomonadales bacterium]
MIKGRNNKFLLALKSFAFIFALLLIVPNNNAVSQGIDPSLLQGLQQQGQGSVNQQSPLDNSREVAAQDEDLRKAQEAAIAISESVSLLEEDFRGRTQTELSQYGYDVFQSVSLGVNASVGSVPGNYVLGIGDQLIISFVGSTDRTITLSVDREGRVIVPDLNPMHVAGRQFAEFERDLKAKVADAMLGTDVFVSLGAVRQIGVYVLGEVSMPGLHNMTSLSTVLQALAKAGGVKKTGSLRAIQVEVAGETRVFDLYALMRLTSEKNIYLQDGAKIIVPTIGRTVAVDGRVARPAIFELAKGENEINSGELISLAGDTTRPRGNDFAVNRFEADGSQSLMPLTGGEETLLAGDIVIVNFKRNAIVGAVFLTGHVQVEGGRPLASNPTLYDLLSGPNSFRPTPYLSFAVIETTDEQSKARVYKHVNLQRVLAGVDNVQLKDQDRVVVFGAVDVRFLSSPLLRAVALSGNYLEGQCNALSELAEFINNFGSDRFSVVSRNVFIESGANKEEDADLLTEELELKNEEINRQNIDLNLQIEALNRQLDEQERRFSEDGDAFVVDDVSEEEAIDDSCVRVFEENPGLLEYTLEYVASVSGSVRTPSLLPVSGEVPLSSVVAFAGGFSRDADLSLVEVLQVEAETGSASERTRRLIVNGMSQSLDNVSIKANYSIRANARPTDQESGTVLLSGEFVRPGVYTISKGETLSKLIERAGGVTEFSYPLGAVFTRLSAKLSQQESFRRAAREIDSALVVASIRSDVAADAIVAAQNLSKDLTTIEALGRVVVEADVSVLRVKPELDTILEPGDKLIMPKRPNFVTIGGDVLNPGALQFISGKAVSVYLAEAGGTQRSADKDRIYLVHPNGVAKPVEMSRWGADHSPVLPGSTIIVPKNLDPLTTFERVTVLTQILSQLALSAASIAVIAN